MMFRKMVKPVVLAMACAGLGVAQAGESDVKEAIEGFIGSQAVEAVSQTQYGGLYEVVLKSGELIYTDEKVSFIIDGRVIDTASREDVTAARQNQLSAIDFSILPLDQAIKQVKGDGSRIVVSFEDPNCGYCKRFGKEFTQLSDVTIYTFLYPILSQDSDVKSRNIWCAKDRAKVWNDWILNAAVPPKAECDSSVIDKNLEFGRSLRVNGTPTLFFADGQRISGYMPATDLDRMLERVKSAKN